ncbi:alpha-N-arabinofuranosidase [Mucilaginibacter frigoritolerans]|uniref:non-reducing end alpha-L-arabinofuranosidase n=1 Tax=Mucilaginibacter frigoritolerans TaxID=652788 RepID=A0A562UFZ8_9SPHI|nr:alpha-L-arabinofuranosidase C-terminal domain-containing protein [Mucilaginibacter frigoritolerans]TWJ04539.1 alpha-N-arabinofuranosidase [Mucilaginibacter frigoritolerans]
MKLSTCLTIIFFGAASLICNAQTTIQLSAVDNGKNPVISKYIYSHFAEHLGHGIYGGFYVGDTSKIPNTNGVRNDVIAALRKMKIPALRWPGGCFADTYHWKDGIGPKDKRPEMVNRWWGGVTEDNSFGTHEFLNMCELLGTEPYLAGNIGSGTVQELSDWVQYVSSDSKNPMSELRKQNGRDKSWKVGFWGVGNEAWGCGGNMTPEYYANEFRKYSTFMANGGDGKMFRVASGASDDDYNWTETLMKNIPHGLVEGVALHHYAIIDWGKKGPSTNFTEKQYFQIMQSAMRMEELVTKHSAIMDKYDPGKKIALVVDEWGGWYDVEPSTNPGFLYQQNTIRDAMIAGVTLNIFNNHSERVRMANLAQCVNVLQAVILTDNAKMILTPTYHVMEMYNVHQDATLIPLTVKTDDYTLGTDKLPAISASASKDKDGVVHISLVNIDPNKAKQVTVNLGDIKSTHITGRILTSQKLQDYNSFTEPDKIKPEPFKDAILKNGAINITMPAASVIVLALN